jgi:hypothetical protein
LRSGSKLWRNGPTLGGQLEHGQTADQLESRLGDDRSRIKFRINAHPPGLTVEEYKRWSEGKRREAEARGEYSFTLDLGAADVR